MRCPLLSAVLLLAGTLSAEAPWTLASALAEARAHSPEATMAAARLARAEAMVEQAGALALPQVGLRAGYIQTNNPMMAFGAILNQGAFSPTIDFNRPGQVDNLNVTGTVGYALYTGGRVTARREAARAGVTASVHDRASTFARLDSAVARSYFGIRQAREILAALDDAVAVYTESLRVAHLRASAGQLLKSELLNLEVQLARTREQQLAARQQANLAARQFLYLLGRTPAGEVVLDDHDPTPTALLVPLAPSVDTRPEIAALTARVAAAAQRTAAARGARRPTVNAFASYQRDHGGRLSGDGDSWTAGIQAEWAVFDGKAAGGAEREALAMLAESEAALVQLNLALALELEQARLGHTFAVEQLHVTATVVSQAEEAARISRERFAAGALLSAELIAVETRLSEARMHRAVATANERLAVAELRRAAGLSLLP